MKHKKIYKIVFAPVLAASLLGLSGCNGSSVMDVWHYVLSGDNTEKSEEPAVQDNNQPVAENDESQLISGFENGSISEKEMFNKLYSLDGYKAGGHVITNIDNVRGNELVTRSEDRKNIQIYKILDGKLTKVGNISADIQANLLYVDENRTDEKFEHRCYFETIDDAGNNQMKVRIYRFRADSGVLVTEKEYLTELYSDGKMDHVKYMDKDGNELDADMANKASIFLSTSWQESFNDDCYEIASVTQTSDVLELSNSYYNGLADPNKKSSYYHYKSDYISLVDDFCRRYYTSGDHPKFVTFGLYINGLSELDACELARYEITARHNLSFDDPLITAFMNKKPEYNADPFLTLEQVMDSFNEHERFNYENYPDHQKK